MELLYPTAVKHAQWYIPSHEQTDALRGRKRKMKNKCGINKAWLKEMCSPVLARVGFSKVEKVSQYPLKDFKIYI